MEQEVKPSCRVGDLIATLETSGDTERADEYSSMVMVEAIKRGLDIDSVLEMSTEDFKKMTQRPPVPIKYRSEGWNFAWGKRVVQGY